MSFKDSKPQFEIVDISLIDPDPEHVRQNVPEDGLKGLTNAIRQLGLIHPLIVRPQVGGRYIVTVGERRRQAAILAGETKVPVLIRECTQDELVDIRVFENMGLGVRSALEPRDMAGAIQTIASRFESLETAAQYFGRPPTWLNQATEAANLSEKVTALLDSGKISSTGAAVQLERLAKKNEAKADSLIEQIAQMPEGEKVSKKRVEEVLLGEKPETQDKAQSDQQDVIRPSPGQDVPLTVTLASTTEDTPSQNVVDGAERVVSALENVVARPGVSPVKVRLVAELLGLSEANEDVILALLIDEFLALKKGAV